jgi:hypothetical protein
VKALTENKTMKFFLIRDKKIKFHESFMKWIVMTYQPYSTCTNKYFREMINCLEPQLQLTNEGTLVKHLIDVVARARVRMKLIMETEYYAMTTDHCTSIGNENYCGATAHWINENWELKSVT